MEESPSRLALEDFKLSGCEEILATYANASLGKLQNHFFQAAEIAKMEGVATAAEMLALMGKICSMVLQPGVRTLPLAPMTVWDDGYTSTGPDHLTATQIELLAELVNHVTHIPLRARMADLVWMKARQFGNRFALRAIDDYRDARLDEGTWRIFGRPSWQRALQLAVPLKAAAADRRHEMTEALVNAFFQAAEKQSREAFLYLQPLADEGLPTNAAPQIAETLEKIALHHLESHHTFDAAAYLEAARTWYERFRARSQAARMQALLGQTWEEHADANKAGVTRHTFYSDAIRAYRAVPNRYRAELGVADALNRVQRKYDSAAEQTIGEMEEIQGPAIDFTDFAESARENVRLEDPLQALYAFCSLDLLPDKDRYIEQAKTIMQESILMQIIPHVAMADDGRTVERHSGGTVEGDPDNRRIEVNAMREFVEDARISAQAMINPALNEIRSAHLFLHADFYAIVQRCGIVPSDRIDVVAQGLYAGYCRDLVQAIHILMPQFEHIVREQLKLAGVVTTTHDEEGLDMEIGLSSLAKRGEMVDKFGPDLTFAIRSLMCEQVGPNLRNAVAHGQADSALCNSPYGLYTWWFVLRMLVTQFRIRVQQSPGYGSRAD